MGPASKEIEVQPETHVKTPQTDFLYGDPEGKSWNKIRVKTPLSEEMLSLDVQRKVLQMTVLSPLCKSYPPALSYQRAFIKKFLQKLEDLDVEICDEIYEAYTDLLRQQEEDDDTLCYKTYTLSPSNTVTLQESVNMISYGTTGLSTWQAAQHLAEWALQNQHVFESRNVLELGSGLGLTGISVIKQCHCKSFTFTDCHTQVLYLLARNIELNLGVNSHIPNTSHSQTSEFSDLNSSTEISDCENTDSTVAPILKRIKRQLSLKSGITPVDEDAGFSEFCESGFSPCDNELEIPNNETEDSHEDTEGDFAESEIYSDHWTDASSNISMLKGRDDVFVGNLDWENPEGSMMKRFVAETDVVIAADVVYDKTVIPSLVSVLKNLLSSGTKRRACAFIASTVRNEDTRDQFLIYMSSEGLHYELVDPPREEIFHYDRSVPIEILRITAPELT